MTPPSNFGGIKIVSEGNDRLMREIGKNLNTAKCRVQKLIGIPVLIKVNSGRGKSSIYRGEVNAVFPAVFSVKLTNGEVKTFSYADVHTKGVMFLKPSDETSED